ncbi:hypothetical protein E2C01_038938 [Portunus trituberculatus]|uniref:Uncharacterized protein n=1 Tax=Portunus trituberculatus TaxID=210409 RepID=A0A5B7FLE2_PORTR|nr:hypothetical protein [Portunus trituberculatus]
MKLPKLLSIEERLTTALGRPLDPQSRSQPHVDTHAHIHAHSSQTYTHSTTQAHVHAKCETTPNTHAQHQHLNPNNSYHHHHHHKGQSATDPHSLGVHRDGGTGSRLSRSMENLPRDIQDHILRCQCSCDHLGYGNYSFLVPHPFHRFPDVPQAASTLRSGTHTQAAGKM